MFFQRSKKTAQDKGVLMFEDEASFQLDPTLHRTWARIGSQPRVATRGERKTAHVFGAIPVHNARLITSFSPVFNGETFLGFLKLLTSKYKRKIHLVIDNAPCHNLDAKGRQWLADNIQRIELHRLPPYSPELNPMEPVWKKTRLTTTHNRYFETPAERDHALNRTFSRFARNPSELATIVRRFAA
jgi:transposase